MPDAFPNLGVEVLNLLPLSLNLFGNWFVNIKN